MLDKHTKHGLLFVLAVAVVAIGITQVEDEQVKPPLMDEVSVTEEVPVKDSVDPVEVSEPQPEIIVVEKEVTPEILVVTPEEALPVKDSGLTQEDLRMFSPKATLSSNWEMVKKNGVLTAEKYAINNNAKATFKSNSSASITYQAGGLYKGKHLLTVVSEDAKTGNTSFAQLKPLFDMQEATETLDLSSSQWEVTIAKLNGVEF